VQSNPFGSFSITVIVAIFCTCAGAQEPVRDEAEAEPVVRVHVRMVMVDAQVLSKKTGRAVGPLRREDFRVYEDGVQQQVTSFSQDELPLSVVFLFDLTDSVRPVLKSLAGGALQALRHLKPEDQVAVMVYAASTQLVQDFTTDREVAAAAIEKASKMASPEAAFFNEGMFQAAGQSAKSSKASSRRVVLWMTDNVPNVPSEDIRWRYGRSIASDKLHTKVQAMTELLKNGTVVYTLLRMSDISVQESFRDPRRTVDGMLHPPGDVYQYSEQTGGHVIEASQKNMDVKLADWIDELRTRYTLGYHPPEGKTKSKFRKIEVKLSPEIKEREGKMFIEAKRGYYR
jgi:VWFA-related protein